MKYLRYFYSFAFVMLVSSCLNDNFQDANESPHQFPSFFFELVTEGGHNFFDANPEIDFENVTIKSWGLPGSGGEGMLVDQSISVMEIEGKKVILSGGQFKERPTFIFYGNGDIDTLTFWRKTAKINMSYLLSFFDDPIFYYAFNGDSLGYFDVVKDELYLRNNFEKFEFNPLIHEIVKTKASIDTER